MSLEQAIAEQTAAIKEQTAVLTKLVTAIAVIAAGEKSTPTPTDNAPAGKKAQAESAKAEPTKEPEPEKTEDAPAVDPNAKPERLTRRQQHAQVPLPPTDGADAPDTTKLPEGERDEAYYAKHVQPVLIELLKLDKEVLKALLAKFKVSTGKDIPSTEWDAAVFAAKGLIAQVQERDGLA